MDHELEVIPGFDNYQICKCGLVWKDGRRDPLKAVYNQKGYEQVGLTKDGRQHKLLTAYLVAEAFIPKMSYRFNRVIHLNGNRRHNYVQNLAWRPNGFAMAYRAQFKPSYEHYVFRKPLELIETGEIFETTFDAATKYGLLERGIYLSAMNPINEVGAFPLGYHFRLILDT